MRKAIFAVAMVMVCSTLWVKSEKVLWSFKGGQSDGQNPWAGVIMDMSGNLFGTTNGGKAVGGR